MSLFVSLISLCIVSDKRPVFGAEKIVLSYPPAEIYMSVDALETFVEQGKITREFGAYSQFVDQQTLAQLRQAFQKRFDFPPEIVSRVVNMPIGKVVMRRIGQLIQTDVDVNGSEAIRAALVAAAADAEGFSLINVIRQFPAQTIRIDGRLLAQAAQEIPALLDYRTVVIAEIQAEAKRQAATEPKISSSQLPSLQERGPYQFTKQTISFTISDLRQAGTGLTGSYQLDVDIFLPEGLDKPSPLVISSHGFGAYRGNNNQAQHLASHGFAVAIPEHIGSNLGYRQSFLRGNVDSLLSPIEYVSRPLDISRFIDRLEQLAKTDPELMNRINLDQIGVVGNSFGATTALTLAGAKIIPEQLAQICRPDNFTLNVSLLLQCRAVYLPQIDYDLRDPRIKVAIAAHPLTSAIFGAEGMSQVQIPTLIVAGSQDIVTPMIQEQVNAFIELKVPEKYFSLLHPGTHFTASIQSDTEGIESVPKVIIGDNYDLGRPYFFGLSVAFFNAYLRGDKNYLPYLSASYNQSLSQPGLEVSLIRSLTLEQLEAAYGKPSPLPITLPSSVVTIPQVPQQSVLDEIQKTGVLKVAIRRDAVPFGYLDQEQQLQGYCTELIDSFRDYLTQKLNVPVEIELVIFPSTVDTRYPLVRSRTVQLECGPNPIQRNISGVAFSQPFFITGAQFLTKIINETRINPNGDLSGVTTGVIRNTPTEEFLRQKYPETTKVYFRGGNAITAGVDAVVNNEIDTFANDGVLTIGELFRQKLPIENYTLVPEDPLTCDFYGLILPAGDPGWRRMVDAFINSDEAEYVWTRWFSYAFPYALVSLEYCLDR
ncbi:MAG: alpha/beta hydrolase [Microcoleaceae cyanobacterium]